MKKRTNTLIDQVTKEELKKLLKKHPLRKIVSILNKKHSGMYFSINMLKDSLDFYGFEANFCCSFCSKTFYSKESYKGHKSTCKPRKIYINNVLNERLLKKWVSMFGSMNRLAFLISKKYGDKLENISAGSIISICKKHNIKTPNLSESASNRLVRNRYKKTCLEKYGCENISSNETIQNKKEKTFIKHYGRKNVFSGKEGRDFVKNKIFEKYGVYNIAHIPGLKRKSSGQLSKPHRKLSNLFKKWRIHHKNEIMIKCKDNTYRPIADILLNDKKIIFEMFGDYWHANPNIYNESDLFNTWTGKKTAKEIWNHDKNRIKLLEECGYKVFVIWEEELKNIKKLKERVERLIC